jgi:hypothetical protein
MSRASTKLSKAVIIAKIVAALPKAIDEATATQLLTIETAKAISSLEPWQQCPTVWKTKAAFFAWMRGQMRRAWARHPVKVAYMQQHRKRVPLGRKIANNPTGLVWGCQCEHCKQEFKQTECEVDHIDAAGSFKGWEDFEAWMHKLMHINFDSIRIVCKECHRIISYAERMGISFEESKLEKEVIAFTKLPIGEQHRLVELLNLKATNAKQRRAAYKQYLQEKL